MSELKFKIAISLLPGIGCILARRLVSYCGSIESVFLEKKNNLKKIPGIGEFLASRISNQQVLDIAEREVEFIHKNNIQPIFYLDAGFPFRLKQCEDGPVMLYAKGNVNFDHPRIISVVGTRKATPYGKLICEQVIADLSKKNHDPIIVSGLAYGIDIQAHREALKNKLQTIAVLGHGFNHIYPPAHRGTAREITHRGAVVTEFTSDTKPDRQNFIKRNRLIAGLADATLVIESAEKGGALITADIAHSYNREVLAVPGRSNDRYSAGCNKLIKTNKAALIESAEDIEKILNWDLGKKSLPVQKELFHNFSEEEELIIAIIRESGEVSMDDIAANSGLPVQKVSSLLFNLDMDGIIQCMPGKIYRVA